MVAIVAGSSATLPETTNVGSVLDKAFEAGKGILRLSPTWVPRSFLHPGKRVRLHPDDYYAFGLDRGGIDERWFASTTEAANEGGHDVATPTLTRFGQMTAAELFISAEAAAAGYTVENTGPGPLVALRYFGPDVHTDLPITGRN